MAEVLLHQPFGTAKTHTWDGVTLTQIGGNITGSTAPSLETDDASMMGGLRSCWFNNKLYSIQNQNVYSWSGSAWAFEFAVGTAASTGDTWNGALWPVLNVTGAPRLYALTKGVLSSTGHQYSWSAAYYDLTAGTWTVVAQNVGLPASHSSYTYLGMGFNPRIIRDDLWFCGMYNYNYGERTDLYFFSPASGTVSRINTFGYTNFANTGDGAWPGMVVPTDWQNNVYLTGLSDSTTTTLYKIVGSNAAEVLDFSAAANGSYIYRKYHAQSGVATFVDPTTNYLICFLRGQGAANNNDSDVLVYQVSCVSGTYTATDISSTVLPPAYRVVQNRLAERWSAFVDNEGGTGTTTRTPSVYLYENTNSSTAGAWSQWKWNGVGSAMTGGTTTTAGTFTGGMSADGCRTYSASQCMPIITNMSSGTNKVTITSKLYIPAGSTNTTGWKVRLYCRKQGEAYASYQGSLANPSQTGATPTVVANEIQGVLAAVAPVDLVFDWSLGGGTDPNDGDKVGIVLYATR